MNTSSTFIRHRLLRKYVIPKTLPVSNPSSRNSSTSGSTSKYTSRRHTFKRLRRLILFSFFVILVTIIIRRNLIMIGNKEKSPALSSQKEMVNVGKQRVWETNGDAVIGFGTGYDLHIYKKFVGSLRRTGFQGNIIIGLEYHQNAEILSYFDSQRVTVKKLRTAKCLYDSKKICLEENTDLNPMYAYYSVAKKWLRECTECTGSVMLASIQSTYFQGIPFDLIDNVNLRDPKEIVHLFEMPLDTENWGVAMHLYQCKKFKWDVPLLSSIVIGDRMSMLFVLETFNKELHDWNIEENCKTTLNGSDLAMLNYLFYNGDIRAKVHEYQMSSGIAKFVTSEEFDTRIQGVIIDASSSPIVSAMDGHIK